MGGKLSPINQNDFSGGANLVTNPYDLKKNQLLRVRNMVLTEHGSLQTRPGLTFDTQSPTTDAVVYNGNLSAATNYPFSIQTVGAKNILYRTDISPWTPVGNFQTAYATPQSVTFLGKEAFAAGYETPWTWDGTTFAQITAGGSETVPPGAKHLAFHLSTLWLWNTNATTTTLDGPSSLRASAVNNIASWPSNFQVFIGKDDGQQGMGLAQYTIAESGISPTTTLIAFKEYSGYQISGSFGGTVAVQKIKSDLGCIAPRTIQFVTGFGIVRLTHKGFALYNGVDDKLISEEIRPGIFGNGADILPINFSKASVCWAAQQPNPPFYVAACPVDGTALTRFFVYDLIRQAWTICDFPLSFQSVNTIFTPDSVTMKAGGASGQGNVYTMMNLSDISDLGAPIEWSFTTPPAYMGSPTAISFWRRLLLDMTYLPGQTVNFSTAIQGVSSVQLNTRTLPVITSEGRTDIDLGLKTTALSSTISGSGNVRVRGLSWQGRSMPLTNSVR
jgi:hypothetical protein